MLMSFVRVNHIGITTGAEVSFRFSDITAVEHMCGYLDSSNMGDDQYELVPGCIVIHLKKASFEVQGDYAELKMKMEQFEDWRE